MKLGDRKLVLELIVILILKIAFITLLWYLFFREPAGDFQGDTPAVEQHLLGSTPASANR